MARPPSNKTNYYLSFLKSDNKSNIIAEKLERLDIDSVSSSIQFHYHVRSERGRRWFCCTSSGFDLHSKRCGYGFEMVLKQFWRECWDGFSAERLCIGEASPWAWKYRTACLLNFPKSNWRLQMLPAWINTFTIVILHWKQILLPSSNVND
jgi:hypothetical protein